MQINSIADNSIQKKQQVISNSGLHFKQTLSYVSSDNRSAVAKENALHKAFINWRSEYISDGIKEAGKQKCWTFPPQNAPASVHSAWDESLEGLSQEEKLLASGRFLGVNLEANIKTDGSGFYEPGDQEYNNQFARVDFSYVNLVETMLARTDEFRGRMSTEQYEQDKTFLGELLATFSRYQIT